jgi:hypothetical protein
MIILSYNQIRIDSIHVWCVANPVTHNIGKTRAITFSRENNTLFYKYEIGILVLLLLIFYGSGSFNRF